jgi:hypothetical protein
MKPSFYLYAIQFGQNSEVLYVNYSQDVAKSFTRFRRKHPHVSEAVLLPDFYSQVKEFRHSRAAKAAAIEAIREAQVKGFEVIAGGPVMNDYWQTYVIELDGNPRHVYVGETKYPREKRFQQHIYHYNSARALRKTDILVLSETLCDTNQYWNQAASKTAEKTLAAKLKLSGYQVEGGT